MATQRRATRGQIGLGVAGGGAGVELAGEGNNFLSVDAAFKEMGIEGKWRSWIGVAYERVERQGFGYVSSLRTVAEASRWRSTWPTRGKAF